MNYSTIGDCAWGIIGYERKILNKSAGFRIHMLVVGAAALPVGIGVIILATDIIRRLDIPIQTASLT